MSKSSWKSIGNRLRYLRLYLGMNVQKNMAELLGASPSQYSNWENGLGLIPVDAAVKIQGLTGASLDYIYTGNASALPMFLQSKLRELGAFEV